ncbi:MAG: hypothetical protein LJF06_00910 [Gemmatimonadetes bacterium]|nr:hypothetical protein [Gemmatimonadota bacterium]
MLPLVPGLVPDPAVLLDERRRPDFRDVFGALARRSTEIAVAVTRVRLTTVDLGPEELGGLRSFRVLVAEVSALQLDAEATGLLQLPRRAPNVRLLTAMLEEGRLEVRSAPLGGWSPDFTVFSGASGAMAVLSGFHWFERPYPYRGPALASLHGPDAARRARARYRELWDAAHDVGPALWSILARADTRTRAVAGG